MGRFRRNALLLLPAWLALGGPVPSAEDAVLEEQTRVRVREVHVRVRPVREAAPGACLDFGLDDLEVALRGEPVERAELLDFERERTATLHAVLIDSSSSTTGKLDFFRDAAAEYARMLRPEHESGMVIGFDESVVLMQPETSDRDELVAAIRRIRLGGATALNDALYFALRELEAHRERPVLVLITDGFDTASLHDRLEIHALAETLPDLVVFTIGVDIPRLTANGPPGMLSTRRFLQRLASDTNGRFFELGTGSRLAGTLARIREELDSEALLTFVDRDPEAEPGRVRVRSRDPDCRISVLKTREGASQEARRAPIPPPFPDPPRLLPLPSSEAYAKYYRRTGKGALDPACSRAVLVPGVGETLSYVAVEPSGLRGCVLDVTMETGLLYDPGEISRLRVNDWIWQITRPFQIPVPPLEELPARIEQAMPAFSELAGALPPRKNEADPHLLVLAAQHARTFHGLRSLCNGTVFFEARPALARALFTYPEYRAWVLRRLQEEAEREILALEQQLSRRSPGASPAAVREAARVSPRARAILARASEPSDVDLQEYLAAWLGDIPAHDLFVRWEIDRIEQRLAGDPSARDFDAFRERWEAARSLLFAPSRARILTLLSPGFDRERGLVGYWRIVLPRASWMLRRIQGYEKRLDYGGLPLDLVPDIPFGLWVVERALEDPSSPLHEGAWRVLDLRYELLGKRYKHDPRRAFGETKIEIVLVEDGTAVRVTARVTLARGRPTLDELSVSPADLAPAASPAAQRGSPPR